MASESVTKVSHTSGPWEIEDGFDIYAFGELMATVYPMKRDGLIDSWKANARLIAAAPEMLEALEVIKSLSDVRLKIGDSPYFSDIFLRAEAALRKAKGEQ